MQSDMSSLVFLQYLTTVFDNIEDAIILVNVEPKGNYRLLMANDTFFRTSGYTRDVIGEPVEKIVPAEGYKELLHYYGKVVQTKKTVNYTQKYEVPIGLITYSIKLIPIINAVGEAVQIAGIIHDITEIECLREKVRETSKTLETLGDQLRAG